MLKPTIRQAIDVAIADLHKFDHPVATLHIERQYAQVLIDAAKRTEAAEAALAAVPVEAIRRYYLHSWSAPAEDYDDATLESDENAFVDWLKAAPQQEVQP